MTTDGRGRRWAEYAIEAAGLGVFMIAAAAFASLIHHPDSPVRQSVGDPLLRRMLMGAAMGATAIAIIYSPAGARSGAHINPATTFTFWRLGRIDTGDAAGYVLAQFAGGLLGISIAAIALEPWIGAPSVNYVATVPGMWGVAAAFLAEISLTFVLMMVVLRVSNDARLTRYTGLCVGALVAIFIAVEDPVSGMSLNPARSLGPALFAGRADTLWIYFLAPPLGMLLAAEAYVRRHGLNRVFCAKLHHARGVPCIFNCRFDQIATAPFRSRPAAGRAAAAAILASGE